MNIKAISLTLNLFFLTSFIFVSSSFAGGLESLESGLMEGANSLQRVGYIVGSLMFVVGAIAMKFNNERGRQILISTIAGIIFLTVAISFPETLKGLFNK